MTTIYIGNWLMKYGAKKAAKHSSTFLIDAVCHRKHHRTTIFGTQTQYYTSVENIKKSDVIFSFENLLLKNL